MQLYIIIITTTETDQKDVLHKHLCCITVEF